MFNRINRMVVVVMMLRLGAVVLVLSAISFGAYISYYGSILTGLMWIISAVVCGWVANMFLRFVILLTDTNRAPTVYR